MFKNIIHKFIHSTLMIKNNYFSHHSAPFVSVLGSECVSPALSSRAPYKGRGVTYTEITK